MRPALLGAAWGAGAGASSPDMRVPVVVSLIWTTVTEHGTRGPSAAHRRGISRTFECAAHITLQTRRKMDVPRPMASKAPLNQNTGPAPATAQHTVGASASSVQESCSLENSLPQPAPLAFTTAMPSGFRRFNKRPTTQGEPQGSVADSQTALSVASPSVYVAAASPIDPLGSTGFRIRKRVKSAEAYIRPHTASTSTEMAPFASERIRAVPMDRCGAAEGAAECDHAICGLNKAFNLLKSPTKAAGTSTQLVCAEPSSTQLVCAPGAQLVPFRAQGQLFLGGGTALTDAQLKEVKFEQRQSNNLYHSAFFFPASRVSGGNLTDEHRLDRQSLRRGTRVLEHAPAPSRSRRS